MPDEIEFTNQETLPCKKCGKKPGFAECTDIQLREYLCFTPLCKNAVSLQNHSSSFSLGIPSWDKVNKFWNERQSKL